jgi:hypothetical protein
MRKGEGGDELGRTTAEGTARERASERKGRAKRLPETYVVTDEMRAWAEEATGFSAEAIDAETEKFRDHFAAVGSTKVDWVATWRNWLRKAVEYRAMREGGRQGGGAERPWLATPRRDQPFDFFAAKRSA